jgi:hypothetical protein
MEIMETISELDRVKYEIKTALEERGATVTGGMDIYGDIIRGLVIVKGIYELPDGMTFAYSTFDKVPVEYDTSLLVTGDELFRECRYLTSIPDSLSTNNWISTGYMFYGCRELTTIPTLKTENSVEVASMFGGCRELTSIPLLDFSSAGFCGNFVFSECYKLTDVGGFKGMKWGMSFVDCPLTHDSALNIINNVGTAGTHEDYGIAKLTFNTDTYSTLSSSEIAIATRKGWVVSVN